MEVAPAAEPIPRDPQVRWWLELAKKKEAREAEEASLLEASLFKQDEVPDPDGTQVSAMDRLRSVEAAEA